MAIVMQMHWPEVSDANYHAVRETVNWETDRPKGAHLHVAYRTADGFHVWDVWDSAEEFDAFVNERLMPGIAQVGVEGQPVVDILPCHGYQFELVPGPGAVVETDTLPAAVYDTMAGKVDWVSVPPVGGIAHVAADAGDGMVQTLSVWTGPDAHEAFERDRLAPAAQAMAMAIPHDGPTAFHPLIRAFDADRGRAGG